MLEFIMLMQRNDMILTCIYFWIAWRETRLETGREREAMTVIQVRKGENQKLDIKVEWRKEGCIRSCGQGNRLSQI